MINLQKIYLAFFGRPADPEGLRYWDQQLKSGVPMAEVAEIISQGTEFEERFSGLSYTSVLEKMVQSLFGRSMEEELLLAYQARLAEGQATIATVIAEILSSAEGRDLSMLNEKVAAANLYTSSLEEVLEVQAYRGEDAADVARLFLRSVTDTHPATPEAVARAIQGLLNSGGGAQSPAPNGAEVNGVQHWLNAAITPHREVDGEKVLLIGSGSAEGFTVAKGSASQLELGLSVRDELGNPLLSQGYVKGHIAGFEEISSPSHILVSIASLGQQELEEFSFKLSIDTDPTDGVSWKHYYLEGEPDHGYAWSLDHNNDGKPNGDDDLIHETLAIVGEQGHFMILDRLPLPAEEGIFDIRLDALEGGFLVVEAAVRVHLIGHSEPLEW
ncbi:DUF4214 domain-containing protein [Pseudorhizobium flavum]|uniref:DUF4214 domain-containing protein n=1 Tax=Pseudorhizobium flavum TaxID=1335061 RepID=A0A7W9Z101_9HYPH|nr:DUF4214 domain-containing protein [Pseudorhizobium flavum]MBB6182053.1 hypothetical protein [Pseudorhizobium flavum]CAD6632103.1 hypothetical protein RFYW14_04606 [Pseudorhizobium flavum]